mmetsp:Transcript_21404/g.37825  ORF Transcript_21404/g.37825 Transcript_21404/m.37825 type:complete len:86 (+) Transcript_21404:2138-2395(+)
MIHCFFSSHVAVQLAGLELFFVAPNWAHDSSQDEFLADPLRFALRSCQPFCQQCIDNFFACEASKEHAHVNSMISARYISQNFLS